MSKRKGIMLFYPFEEKRLLNWKPPFLVQPKYDGERAKTIYLPNISGAHNLPEPVLLSSEENVIVSVPHINKALYEQDICGVPVDGELYIHGRPFDGIDGISSICSRTVNLHPDSEAMEYYIFDIISDEPQWKRIQKLNELKLFTGPPLVIAPTEVANTLEEVMAVYDGYIGRGYEGIIVRHIDAPYVTKRSIYGMKFKPKKKDYYMICYVIEALTKDTKEPKGMAGAIKCIDDMGTTFKTAPGIGWTEVRKIELWNNREDAIGKWCEIDYQNITSGKNVPRFGRFVSIVDVNPERISPIDLPV